LSQKKSSTRHFSAHALLFQLFSWCWTCGWNTFSCYLTNTRQTKNCPVSHSPRALPKEKKKDAFVHGYSQSEVAIFTNTSKKMSYSHSVDRFILEFVTFQLVFVYILVLIETNSVEMPLYCVYWAGLVKWKLDYRVR